MAPALTQAQQYLQARQRRHPPRYPVVAGLDRVQQLYEVLRPELPPKLHAMLANGAIALGEVGNNVPDVRVIPLGKGAFVIVFTSGMMDFQYAVARALAGLDQANADLEARPQTVVDVASLVERVLRQWARYMKWHWLWPWRRITWANFPITPDAREWIENLVTIGELSMLAHELGHIALDCKIVKPHSANNEIEADRCGLGFLIPAVEKRWHKRIAYAGPIVPIRILAAMERLGVRFSEQYPPQAERLELLKQQLRIMCPSKQYFYEATTVLVSWQDMLDDIENHIDPNSPPAVPSAERVLIRLLAELEELARGNVSLLTVIENIGYLSRAIPHSTIKQATGILVSDYANLPPPNRIFLKRELRVVMAAKLHELIAGLPPDLKSLFPPSAHPASG